MMGHIIDGIEMVKILKSTLSIPVQYFLKTPPGAKPLTHIMNISISTATIPPEWKTVIVTPYKNGSCSECSKPILSCLLCSKFFKKTVFRQLYNYLLLNHLTDTQSDFRPQHSTLTPATDGTDYILSNMDKGERTGAVFLDLKGV